MRLRSLKIHSPTAVRLSGCMIPRERQEGIPLTFYLTETIGVTEKPGRS